MLECASYIYSMSYSTVVSVRPHVPLRHSEIDDDDCCVSMPSHIYSGLS